jgi:hypothetical protein
LFGAGIGLISSVYALANSPNISSSGVFIIGGSIVGCGLVGAAFGLLNPKYTRLYFRKSTFISSTSFSPQIFQNQLMFKIALNF